MNAEAAIKLLEPFLRAYEPWIDERDNQGELYHPDDQMCTVHSRHTFGELRRLHEVYVALKDVRQPNPVLLSDAELIADPKLHVTFLEQQCRDLIREREEWRAAYEQLKKDQPSMSRSWIDRASWCAGQLLDHVLPLTYEQQDELGMEPRHLRWMARQLAERRLDSETKACRWLGWLQAGVVFHGFSSLETEKQRNLASLVASPRPYPQDNPPNSLKIAIEALVDATTHLVAAASAYRKYAWRHPSQGRAQSDDFFSTRVVDFERGAERAHKALTSLMISLPNAKPDEVRQAVATLINPPALDDLAQVPGRAKDLAGAIDLIENLLANVSEDAISTKGSPTAEGVLSNPPPSDAAGAAIGALEREPDLSEGCGSPQTALNNLADLFQHWVDYNVSQREREGLKTEPDTHVIAVPPHWPSHLTLRTWVAVLRKAALALATPPAADIDSTLVATITVSADGSTRCHLAFGSDVKFDAGKDAVNKAVTALETELAESSECPAAKRQRSRPASDRDAGSVETARLIPWEADEIGVEIAFVGGRRLMAALSNADIPSAHAALQAIAALTPEPNDKQWYDQHNEIEEYTTKGADGEPRKVYPDDSNHDDLVRFGREMGLHDAAIIAREALARSFPSAEQRNRDAGSGERTQAEIDVLAERQRQVEVEGWSAEHDDTHVDGELAFAAASYSVAQPLYRLVEVAGGHGTVREEYDSIWPWRGDELKNADRRRSLVKAGALILAEIERLDRASRDNREA